MAASPAMEKLHNMVATSAIHDGKRDRQDYTDVCHPGTREEYLENLKAWADNAPPDTRVEWVNAIAGAGKTAMMRTFCTLLEDQGLPPFSFFVWKGDAKRNTLEHFPATIAYQLCQTFPVLVPLIEKAINAAPLLLQSTFKKQMDKLVICPLLDACDTIKDERHLIVAVDGLDELDAKGQTDFLNFIPYLLSRLSPLPISLLVSSRPDAQIVGTFNHPKLASITRATRLGASDADIRKFLEDKFEDINLRHPYLQIEHHGKWPGHKKLEIMVRQSSGLFIWPTVAIGHIDKMGKGLDHNARLKQVLSSAEPKPWVGSPLDNLYRAILEAHAPEDRNSFEFLRFKRRLALLCILDLRRFVRKIGNQVIDWSDAPVRIIFDETLDELWSSVAGLSSLISPRKALGDYGSPTPGISHRSLRDFTFSEERCGEELYYSSEQELRAEVVCKIIKFFNTRQAYQSSTGMSAWFIDRAGELLESHLEEAAVSEELGCCIDDIVLDYIPSTWPLVAQKFAIIHLFGGLYRVAEYPDFPEGSRRRKTLLSKVTAFIKIRAGNAQEWDAALCRLATSAANFTVADTFHSVHCWHIARSLQCPCIEAYMRCLSFYICQGVLQASTLFQDARSRLVEHRQVDIAQDSLVVLQFFLSLSETSQRATELSPFISIQTDCWIIVLLHHCPPNDDLYSALGPICTAPLPDLPKREEVESWELVSQFLRQTEAFDEYTKRCQAAGTKRKFPSIKIPDDWWEDKKTRTHLLFRGYTPASNIPEDWWKDEKTRFFLLKQGYEPMFDIPVKWWQDGKEIRQILRNRGYPPPDPYSVEDTTCEAENRELAVQEAGADQHASRQDEPLPDRDTLSGVVSPKFLPPHAVPLPDPLHTPSTALAHPATTLAVGAQNAGGPLRGFQAFLKNIFRR